MRPMLSHTDYGRLRREFRWNWPERLNMADQAIGDRARAEPQRTAIIEYDGTLRPVTYAELAGACRRIR